MIRPPRRGARAGAGRAVLCLIAGAVAWPAALGAAPVLQAAAAPPDPAPAAAPSPPPAPPAPPSGRGFAPVNGTRLFYEVRGEGEPVVLLHGGQLDSRMWDDQFDRYARRFRVLRYDVRGFGGSPQPDLPFADHEDLAALLDYAGIPRAHLVGLSLGGRIAIDFALVHPERALSLVLAGPGLSGFDLSDPEGDERWWNTVTAARDGRIDAAIDLWLTGPYMAPAMERPDLAARLRRLAVENAHVWLENPLLQRRLQPGAATRLAEIRAPTLIVLGDRDVPVIKAIVDRLFKEIPGARRTLIRGAGHMVNMEAPVEFDRAVLGFLREVARGAAAR